MAIVYSGYSAIYNFIWDENIWFPPGVNWTTFKTTDHEKFPDFRDMYYPIAYAFVILAIRTVFECWRCAYYCFAFVYGLVVLWDKPWFWDTAHCWYGYPFQVIHPEIWWYYMIESSFYWSLMFSQFTDVHRKDFAMNFVHHLATLALLWFSWADNFVRIGSMVLVTHDAADIWVEAGKMALYCKYERVYNVFLSIFSVVWFLTRICYFPFWLIYSTLIEAPALLGFYAAYYIFNCLLMTVQVLHILWTIMIVKIILNAKRGEPSDVRSDDEDESEDVSSPSVKKAT